MVPYFDDLKHVIKYLQCSCPFTLALCFSILRRCLFAFANTFASVLATFSRCFSSASTSEFSILLFPVSKITWHWQYYLLMRSRSLPTFLQSPKYSDWILRSTFAYFIALASGVSGPAPRACMSSYFGLLQMYIMAHYSRQPGTDARHRRTKMELWSARPPHMVAGAEFARTEALVWSKS